MILRKYRLYKKILRVLLAVNLAFIMIGIVAAVKYFKEYNWSHAEMMIVGSGVLVFGIILPAIVIRKLEQAIKAWEVKIQKTVSQWVGALVQAQADREGETEFYQDPTFWINMAMTTLESLKRDIQHPLFIFFAEMAPYIRQAMSVPRKGKTRKKVSD